MSKNAIMTLIVGNETRSYARYTYPLMVDYAKRIGVSLLLVDDQQLPAGVDPMLGKLKIYTLLEEYDCICYLDADIIVSPKAPNLFDELPSDRIGMTLDMLDGESCGRRVARCAGLEKVLGSLTESQRHSFAYHSWNAGFILLPKAFRELYHHDIQESEELKRRVAEQTKICSDQDLLNYWLVKGNFPMNALPMVWHHMVHNWHLVSRFGSYFVHYGFRAKTAIPWDMPIWNTLK